MRVLTRVDVVRRREVWNAEGFALGVLAIEWLSFEEAEEVGRERLNRVLPACSARVERVRGCMEELRACEERVWTPRADVSVANVGLRRDWDRVRAGFVVVSAEGILFPRPMVLIILTVSEVPSSCGSICVSSVPNCAAKSAKLGAFGVNIVAGLCFIGLGPVTLAFSDACLCVAATNVPGWRSRLWRLDRFRGSPGEVERKGILGSVESVMMGVRLSAYLSAFLSASGGLDMESVCRRRYEFLSVAS